MLQPLRKFEPLRNPSRPLTYPRHRPLSLPEERNLIVLIRHSLLRPRQFVLTVVAAASPSLLGCGNKTNTEKQAPETPSLEQPAAAPTALSKTFNVDSAGSNVEFLMEAPVENIHGKAPESVEGTLSFDLMDLSKSSGLIKIDLLKLAVYQTTRQTENDEFGEETKNDDQNAHMKNWFQISEDAPEELREANRYIEFRMNAIQNASSTNVMEMEGSERTVTAVAQGDFRLHGRTTEKSARIELTFVFEGDEAKSVRIKSLDPVNVSLEEHEIQPRETFEKLAQKTLSALGQKVSDTAPVTFEFTATL